MSVIREHVDVRVRNHTLWIDTDAYLLDTATRATVAVLAPDRTAAVRDYAVSVAWCLFPAAVLSAVTPAAASALLSCTALVWFAARTAGLARSLRSAWYELSIDTTATAYRILVGEDLTTISEIGFRITEAINDPSLEFHFRTDGVRRPEIPSHSQQEGPPDRINLP